MTDAKEKTLQPKQLDAVIRRWATFTPGRMETFGNVKALEHVALWKRFDSGVKAMLLDNSDEQVFASIVRVRTALAA